MNKKVSTLLTVAMVLGGSLLSTSAFADSAPVDIDQAVKDGKYYSLKVNYKYDGSWTTLTEPGFVVPGEGGVFVRNVNLKAAELGDNVWKVTKVSAGGINEYTFTNKKDVKFSISQDAGFTVRDESIDGTESFSLNKEGVASNPDTKYVVLSGNELKANSDNETLAVGFLLESYSEENITAQELNSIQGGDGLIFAYPSETAAVTGDILTGKQLLAVEVKSDNNAAKEKNVKEGVYFVVKASEDLKLEKDGTLKNDADQVKAFLASEFIAVNPSYPSNTSNWNVTEGVGFTLTTVSGENLSTEDVTKGTTVALKNACFNISEPDVYNAENQYELTVAAALETEKGKDHKENTVKVAVKQAQGTSYLVTSTVDDNEVAKFKTQASATSALIDATTLLNSDKTPSIYAIKVLSGYAKDQYLTNGKYSLPGVDVNDPTNQYVITSVENNVVTFKSRVNTSEVKMSFYGDNADLTFKVVAVNDDAKINYAKSEGSAEISFTETNLNAETVELIKVTPTSKFDSFVNVEEEDYKLVTFSIASYAGSADALNLVAGEGDDKKLYLDEENATQFVLTGKNYDAESTTYNTFNTFVYLKGEDVEEVANGDTVAYPSYNVSVYDPAILVDKVNAYSIKKDGAQISNTDGEKGNFVIKVNKDGSLLFIENGTVKNLIVNTSNTAAVTPMFETLTNMSGYVNRTYRTFMTPTESASVSLEAKSQHVSMMETVAGGYVTADVNNDAIVKGAEAAAVLWLDTTKTEATVPTFYISQGGKFLYNAEDSISATSTDYKVPGTNTAKLIFKKAELLNSDTLKTTVAGREVLVADNDNKLQNVVKGIENFQYQILKAKEENEYVVRQGTDYVQSTNGYLTLTAKAEDAMHVVVESQTAPTSNENVVVASEVKVIANNGSIVVKNAAGKNVVVSTILGQVVANEVLTSDNATINVPAGIVVVAVEGESFKVNVR